MTIHSENKQVIREFALQKPVSRLLVNTPGALGGVGATTNLQPALTLGCGAVGGSATSDNVGPLNLINVRRVATGVVELAQLRQMYPVPEGNSVPEGMEAHPGRENNVGGPGNSCSQSCAANGAQEISENDLAEIVRAVMKRLGA